MSRPKFLASHSFLLTAALSLILLSLPAAADSHVRIVRLSYIEGEVQVANSGATTYQKAIVNLPVSEGMKLKTADDGRAEIEFEDGSTLHIVPNSEIAFPRLLLRDSGAKVSQVEVAKGTAYVNFAGAKNDEFSLEFGHESIALTSAAHLRIDVAETSSVALFKGLVQVQTPGGALELKKNQTLSFDATDTQPKLAKNIRQEPFDDWDDQQNEYHTRYAMKSHDSYSPYAYGTTDLAYYGAFFNYPGYGMMWQPYFAGVAWDPFMDGAWMFSPGWGYGWVSAYPWGWTPYHYGTWVFLPGRGWAWQPGGAWSTWYGQPVLANVPRGFAVPRPPVTGSGTVFVSRGAASTFAGSKLLLHNNSAGLGVPRGQLGNMAKLSERVQTHGTVSRRIEPQPSMMGRSGMGAPEMGRAQPGNSGRMAGANRGGSSSGRGASSPRPPAPMPAPMPPMGGMGSAGHGGSPHK